MGGGRFGCRSLGRRRGRLRGPLREMEKADPLAPVRLRVNAIYGLGLVAAVAHRGEAGAAERARGFFEEVIRLDPGSE